MKLYCAINGNIGYGAMDRVYLEGWLLANMIDYKLGRRGDFMCHLTAEQVSNLRSEGWPVYVIG